MEGTQLLPDESTFWTNIESLGFQKCQFFFPGFPGADSLPVSLDRIMRKIHLDTGGVILGLSGEVTDENNCHKKVDIKYKQHSGQIIDICGHIKSVPLLDIIDVMKGKYVPEKVVSCLPSRERELDRTYEKINDHNNQAYVDCLAGYVLNTLQRKCPGFPRFYGHFTGLTPQLKIDITEDFYSIRNEAWFHRGIGNRFTIEMHDDMYTMKSGKNKREIHITDEDFGFTEELKEIAEDPSVIAKEWVDEDKELEEVYVCDESDEYESDEEENETDDESEGCEGSEGEYGSDNESEQSDSHVECGQSDFGSGSEEDDSNSDCDTDSDYSDMPDEGVFFAIIPNIPVQSAIYESLCGPIDGLMSDESITENEWIAILFQICFSLAIAQQEFSFIHNDLHTNNVMWVPTDKEYIHYKVNDTVYKIPTYGKIIKIIDYGRSYYKYFDKEYISDAYRPKGDAAGQYNYPPYYNPKESRVPPNPSFDLPRLACSMYEGLFTRSHDPSTSELSTLLHSWLMDSRGKSILWNKNGEERFGGFLLYKHIARYCNNVIPINELENNVFSRFIHTNSDNNKDMYDYCIRK